jgi:tellurium resistance protein TerD
MAVVTHVDLEVIDRVSGETRSMTYRATTAQEAIKCAGRDGFAVARAGKPYTVEERCPTCGALERFTDSKCAMCGHPDPQSVDAYKKAQSELETRLEAMRDEQLARYRAQSASQQVAEVKCPNCGSTQITGGREGFSLGKAAVGGLILGPVGLLGGLAGSKKVVVGCLKCGHRWAPGG